MPVLSSQYHPPLFYRNGHVQSVLPTLFRKVEGVDYRRERISTPDGDFLDLDWSGSGSDRLMIISHGLEGHSDRNYVKGMAAHANRSGWDACAWNFRGCSGEPNRRPFLYHSGATYDLHTVVEYIRSHYDYEHILLVGFSLGGNLTIKYFGEQGDSLDRHITGGVAFSVPADLVTSSYNLARAKNKLYMNRFIRKLGDKIRAKEQLFPEIISSEGFSEIKNFEDFDNRYTAPLHGFRDALDYWQKASSKPYISGIKRPLLLVNAKDDPFLTGECFPVEEAENNPFFYLEMPNNGGHTGFIANRISGIYWSEKRVIDFYHNQIEKTARVRDSANNLFEQELAR